jgi:hypothetical protein
VYVLRQNCRAAGWRWDSINKTKVALVYIKFFCHLILRYFIYLLKSLKKSDKLFKGYTSDQKENKPEQALQIIGQVVTDF